MNKYFLLLITPLIFNTCFGQTITYPAAPKKPVTETFYKNYTVTDNYRWMENLDNPDLKNWVTDESEIAEKYITRASAKNNTMQRIDELATVTYHTLKKKGNYYFFYAYYNSIGLPALFIQNRVTDDEPRVIVDPNFISHKDNIVIKTYEVSHDSKYLAYSFSRNGSDWAEIKVCNTNGSQYDDHLLNVKFSNIAWRGNGFFYSAYPQVANLGQTQGQVIYYHKIGTQQADDVVVFKRNDPTIEFTFTTSKDEKYFILQEHNKKAGIANYFYIDYQDTEPTLKPLLTNLKYSISILDSHDGKFIETTTHNANNGTIVEIDPKDPLNWKVIAPAFSEALLLEVIPFKDRIVATYQSKMHPGIVVMDYEGKVLHSQPFPLGTSISLSADSPEDVDLLYYYQSYTTPPVTYSFNINGFERKRTSLTTVSFDYDNFEYKQVEYTTNDSVKIPMMLIYRKDIKLNGTNPTLLETYGGFGVVNHPDFDAGLVYFLSRGGVYAYAYVRGEGELGADWAKAGKGSNKQTSFSDFIAGAEYLIKSGYTSANKLAIHGASNGGLVVAAAAMQRPELFKAVIPEVAPFDMLRFENFTIGALDAAEYGSVKDSTGFKQLYNYSPYNNIKPNVNYPAMLIITSENDDRVPPLHSYKFAAEMQSRPAQTNPVLLLVNKKAGHNGIASNNIFDMLHEKVNLYAFVAEILK